MYNFVNTANNSELTGTEIIGIRRKIVVHNAFELEQLRIVTAAPVACNIVFQCTAYLRDAYSFLFSDKALPKYEKELYTGKR